MAKYRALVGISYEPNKRAEVGDIVDDLPAKSIKWLLEDGYIESADSKGKPAEEPAEEPAADEGADA